MSILSEAWRRARSDNDAVSRALGAPPLAARGRRGHLLPWVLSGFLLVAVVGMGVYLWRSHANGRTAGSTQAVSIRAVPPAAARTTSPTARGGTPSVDDGKPHRPAPKSAGRSVGGRASHGASGEAGARSHAAVAAALGTMPDALRAQMPPIDVTVHVWNPQPASRFVMINGRMYHEGDRLGHGLRLLSITPTGEIVEFRGYQIELGGND